MGNSIDGGVAVGKELIMGKILAKFENSTQLSEIFNTCSENILEQLFKKTASVYNIWRWLTE